jgi:hypothetical protein
MEMDTNQWHRQLIDKLGWSCRIDDCSETIATKLRYRVNPIWGLDEDGQTPLTEPDFLAEVATLVDDPTNSVFTTAHLQALCEPHFEATLPKSVSGTAQTAAPAGDRGAGPSEHTHARTKGFRSQVIDLLGQSCSKCGKNLQVKSFEVRLREDVAASYWAQHGMSSWADKYEFLASGEIDPKELVELVCRFCSGSRMSSGTSAAKQNLREQVVAGYGGKCGVCKTEVSKRNAWVVRKPGYPALRHAGGQGRKLTSKQKYERLLAEGCPESHELRCPSHRDSDSLSAES